MDLAISVIIADSPKLYFAHQMHIADNEKRHRLYKVQDTTEVNVYLWSGYTLC